MQQILNKNGSFSGGASSWEDGDNSKFNANNKNVLIANSVPLEKIFKYYNVDCGKHCKKIKCPFKSHNGGNENTPSFCFYPETNTFYCFGCKVGQRPSDFVSEFEDIDKKEAIQKIIDLFQGDIDEDYVASSDVYEDKLKIMMEFSDKVRDVISSNVFNLEKVEKICKAYDVLNEKHNLTVEALKSIQEKLFLQLLKLKE